MSNFNDETTEKRESVCGGGNDERLYVSRTYDAQNNVWLYTICGYTRLLSTYTITLDAGFDEATFHMVRTAIDYAMMARGVWEYWDVGAIESRLPEIVKAVAILFDGEVAYVGEQRELPVINFDED